MVHSIVTTFLRNRFKSNLTDASIEFEFQQKRFQAKVAPNETNYANIHFHGRFSFCAHE